MWCDSGVGYESRGVEQYREVWAEAYSGVYVLCFFFQAEDGIRDSPVTGVQTCALPIYYT